jgi:predicted acyltransferase (DUF342 family)
VQTLKNRLPKQKKMPTTTFLRIYLKEDMALGEVEVAEALVGKTDSGATCNYIKNQGGGELTSSYAK